MSDQLKKFPKGKIKPAVNFYLCGVVAVLIILMGMNGVITKEIQIRKSLPPVDGELAVYIGYILIIFGIFALYHLLCKARNLEESISEYHELEDFDDVIDGYRIKFEILGAAAPSGSGSAIRGFLYALTIVYKKEITLDFTITRRGKLGRVLWKIGLLKIFDVLTDNKFFDEKYRVECVRRDICYLATNLIVRRDSLSMRSY